MIVKYSKLDQLRKIWKNEIIVCGGGCFDVIHESHIDFLKILKKNGDKIVVLINNDKRVQEKKGALRPIFTQAQRAKIIDSIKYVDATVICPPINNATEYCLKKLKPNKFICAYKNRWKKQKNFFKENNIKLICKGAKRKQSTTRIINKILKSNIT